MDRYWRLIDIPELHALPRKVRSARWSDALKATETRTLFWSRQAVVAVPLVIGIQVSGHLHWRWYEQMALVGCLVGIGAFAFELARQPRARQWLREHPFVKTDVSG